MEKAITPEALREDRERRAKEREEIADNYDAAADALIEIDSNRYRRAIAHLRLEALDWRKYNE